MAGPALRVVIGLFFAMTALACGSTCYHVLSQNDTPEFLIQEGPPRATPKPYSEAEAVDATIAFLLGLGVYIAWVRSYSKVQAIPQHSTGALQVVQHAERRIETRPRVRYGGRVISLNEQRCQAWYRWLRQLWYYLENASRKCQGGKEPPRLHLIGRRRFLAMYKNVDSSILTEQVWNIAKGWYESACLISLPEKPQGRARILVITGEALHKLRSTQNAVGWLAMPKGEPPKPLDFE